MADPKSASKTSGTAPLTLNDNQVRELERVWLDIFHEHGLLRREQIKLGGVPAADERHLTNLWYEAVLTWLTVNGYQVKQAIRDEG